MSAQNTGSQASMQTDESPEKNPAAQQSAPPGFPIRLADVLLYECQIKRYAERADKFMAQGAALNVEAGEARFNGQLLELPLVFHIKVPANEEPAWLIDLLLIGIFVVETNTDQELIEAFIGSSALPFIWPYAREIVQNLTTRMRVLPLLLPALDLRSWSQHVEQGTNTSDTSPEVKAE